MPHDLDFRRRPTSDYGRSATLPSVASGRSRRRRRQPPVIASVLLIFSLITAGASLIYQSQAPPQPTSSTIFPVDQTAVSAAANQPPTESKNPPFGPPLIAPSILEGSTQIYNAGAGEEAIAAVIAKLAEEGIAVKNLGRSQFEFDQSFIWHQPEQEGRAQEIASKLGRPFTLKKSQIAGGFDILIYLGKD